MRVLALDPEGVRRVRMYPEMTLDEGHPRPKTALHFQICLTGGLELRYFRRVEATFRPFDAKAGQKDTKYLRSESGDVSSFNQDGF